MQWKHLLVVLVGLVVDDVEELELVNTSGGGDDSEPVTKLLLLEELLCPVFDKLVIANPTDNKRQAIRLGVKHTGT